MELPIGESFVLDNKGVPRLMAKKNVADLLVDTLAAAGVQTIYGVTGDSLNGITDSIRRQEQIRWIHVRNEEAAAFAAGAEAHLTGRLAVCAGSCGPGNLHLINGLYDCHRSRVPVLAIAAQIPSHEIGSGYFQETHPEHLFAQCSHYCELARQPEQMPRVLEIAMQTAIARRGVAVVALPGDIALRDAVVSSRGCVFRRRRRPCALPTTKSPSWPQVLNASKKITILGGAGCAGAHAELIELAGKLKAPIVHAMRGKEFIEYDNPFDVGMTGLLGFSSGYHAMMNCDTAADDRHGFSLSAVLSQGRDDRPDRPARRTTRPPHQGRLRICRRHEDDPARAAAASSIRTTTSSICTPRSSIISRRAKGLTIWPRANRARNRSIRNTWPESSTNWPPTTRSSPAMWARRRSGPRAI